MNGYIYIYIYIKIINIITIDVHSRDVVEKFVITKVAELESFAWLS